MAFKQINKILPAIKIGNKKEKGMIKTFTGFLISVKNGVGKTKKRKGSNVYRFQSEKGVESEVWGNASIDGALTHDGEHLHEALIGLLVKLEFDRIGKAKPGQNPPYICNVWVDDTKRLKLGKVKTVSIK